MNLNINIYFKRVVRNKTNFTFLRLQCFIQIEASPHRITKLNIYSLEKNIVQKYTSSLKVIKSLFNFLIAQIL